MDLADLRLGVEPIDDVLAAFASFDAVGHFIAEVFRQPPDFSSVCHIFFIKSMAQDWKSRVLAANTKCRIFALFLLAANMIWVAINLGLTGN